MIIYEVNLTVDNEIIPEYQPWLVKHAKEMLQFSGFVSAEIAQEIPDQNADASKTRFTVRYFVETKQQLDDYLQHHATRMRGQSAEKFNNKFSATRRIFASPTLIKKL